MSRLLYSGHLTAELPWCGAWEPKHRAWKGLLSSVVTVVAVAQMGMCSYCCSQVRAAEHRLCMKAYFRVKF